jgi:hypothetical protein
VEVVRARMSALQHDELLTQSEILVRIVAGKKD